MYDAQLMAMLATAMVTMSVMILALYVITVIALADFQEGRGKGLEVAYSTVQQLHYVQDCVENVNVLDSNCFGCYLLNTFWHKLFKRFSDSICSGVCCGYRSGCNRNNGIT